MPFKSNEIQRARWSLINQIFDQVRNVPSYSNLRSKTFCVIAYLGLQLIAKEEDLLDRDDWYNLECKDELLEKVKAFLIKYKK